MKPDRKGVLSMSRIPQLAATLALATSCAAVEQGAPAKAPAPVAAKPDYVQMADSVIARHPSPLTLDSAKPAWNYTQGLLLKGVLAVYD